MRYYVYRHIRLDTNQPFYIGMGSKPQEYSTWKSEYARAYSKCGRSKWWLALTRKTPFEIEILYEAPTKEEVFRKEKEFVALYGRRNIGTGKLVNLTDGGLDGGERRKSRLTRSKLSNCLHKGRKVINLANAKTYNTVREAAISIGFGYSKLRGMLEYECTNTTNLRYYNDK